VIRCYSEVSRIDTFEDRFRYLSLRGVVGEVTFGFDRYLNQEFYRSKEWRKVRQEVIIRDNGCDLAFPGFEIHDRIYIHHMNPMSVSDIVDGDDGILDPELLICVTMKTHNAIHYGDESQLPREFKSREPGDTASWGPIRR
jgi:hypothetical protein